MFRSFFASSLALACVSLLPAQAPTPAATPPLNAPTEEVAAAAVARLDAIARVVAAAKEQIGVTKAYDPAYSVIGYPGGDVPLECGVCTDVIVRAYRKAGVDFQKLVHEDMKSDFARYPTVWGLKAPDSNIDHRRVQNLMTFFKRAGKRLILSKTSAAFLPGDIVVWRLPNGLLHTGLVSDLKSGAGVPLIVHNIGAGAQQEDILFEYEMVARYRWL